MACAKECWICEGSGTISRTIWLQTNRIKYGFQEKHLRRIADLPEARLFVCPDNTKEARFDFTGGHGVLMPAATDTARLLATPAKRLQPAHFLHK